MDAPANAMHILVIDDHPVYSDGIAYMLQVIFPEATILQAHTGQQALTQVSDRIDIDWIFMDFQLPDMNGHELLTRFNELMIAAPIILMSGNDDVALVAEGLERGASGFIPKAHGKATFQACLDVVQAGQVYLPPDLKGRVDHYRRTVLDSRNMITSQLSGRRQEVLVLMSEGYTNAEMASTLGIAEATVKTHVSALLSIFDVDNRSHCIAEARKLGILK
jgi:DNA-binding NarL/FixJ family response regulator